MKYLVIVPVAVLLNVGITAWWAYVEWKLWTWFAVPAFHAPQMLYAQAFGLAALGTLLRYRHQTEDLKLGRFFIDATTTPAMFLVVGMVAKHFAG